SVDSLLKATEGSYVVVRNVVARDDRTSDSGGESTMVAMVRDTLRNRPDAILLGGGIEGGAVEPVLEAAMDVAIALAASEEGGKVHVVFAGNRDARTDIVRILGDSANLHVVDNVRPTLADEDLGAAQEELRSLYRETKMGRAPGFGELKSWVSAPVMATAEGLELALRYLSRAYQLDTVAVDVGGSATHVAGVIGGRLGSTVSAHLGMGYGIRSILDEVGIDRILRWLPFEMDEDQAYNQILNKALRPMTVPETVEGLLLEQAAAREAISLTLDRARGRWLGSGADPVEEHVPPVDLIVGRGGVLSEAPVRGLAVLILLDAIQPTGICALALDQASLLPQLGALASLHPLAATQVLARDGILKLGTVISLTGSGKEGAVALKLKIDYDDGQSLKVEVPYGAMEVIPLMEGRRAVVELRPSSRFDVGLGKKGKGATTELDGGALGIIVDARGRPLSLPGDGEKRRAKIREWMGELGI
ncbi:MAG TPA: glutamate mutase L, partial [Anaerolineae bacterium]|nr:glutamate mutase L [Anaerolineae bacterium]